MVCGQQAVHSAGHPKLFYHLYWVLLRDHHPLARRSQASWQLAQVRLKLRWEEEALASGETPPESRLLGMVEELIFEVNNGGPILECLFEDMESGRVEL